MEGAILHRIREANAKLQRHLHRIAEMLAGRDSFGPAEVRAIGEPVAGVAPVLAEAQRLRATVPELRRELDVYAENLTEMQTALDRVRLVLLARSASLEAQRGHLETVGLWAAAWQKTR
jgi:hypothetical protein